jgi:SAM-dependent methyltransferase
VAESVQSVHDRYTGEAGRDYQRSVHSDDDFTQSVVARSRRRKLQPFVRADDDVLEFGAGTCLNLRGLECRSKTGYDLSDAGRDTARRHGIEFVTELDALAGRQFSVVLCHHVLEHVADPLGTLVRMRELVKPGGRLVLSVPFETHRMYRRYFPGEPNHHLFSWNALTLGNLVHDAGFEVIESRISPFGYEQRLAPLAKLHDVAYRCGLALVRTLRPANEVFLVGRKPTA